MLGELGHGAGSNDDLDSSLSESLDEGLEGLLLTLGVVEEILGVSEEHGTLSLTLLHLDVGVEDGDLAVEALANGSHGSAGHDHTVDNLGVENTATKNLEDAHVVGAEVVALSGHGVDGSLGDEASEEVLETELLGSNGGLDEAGELSNVSEVLRVVALDGLEKLHSLGGGLLVADEDLGGMESHGDQRLSLGHKLTSHADEKVGAITAFVLLHLGSLSDHFSSGVMDISLSDDGGSVRGDEKLLQMVNDHLVHA